MKMTNEEYKEFAGKHAPRSDSKGNSLRAFLVGGFICCIGQLLSDLYGKVIADETVCSSAVSVTLVFIGVLLTGLGVYDDIARFAGAGTLVPITGFANSVAAPAIEFKTEGLITGTAAKMFVIAGPVIVYGITAGAIYGLIFYFL